MKKISFWKHLWESIRARKFTIISIVIICVFGGYQIYKSALVANAEPQYVLSPVRIGSIIQKVSGTGQVSASNQTDILSQVSGTITSINVSVGQSVYAGQLIATIDSKNASITLKNAQISYQKLIEPAKTADISNSKNSVEQSYTTAYNAASNIYLDMPNIVSGMKDLLYGQTGFLSDQRSTYLISSARTYRDTVGMEYDAAVKLYETSLNEFKSTSRTSATSSIDKMLSDTYKMIQAMSKAVNDTQTAITYITTSQSDYFPKDAPTANTNATTWATQLNSDLASLASARNSIESNQNSYVTLVAGADQYDVEQAKLSLEQAEQTYSNYFVRAPYDGIIGRIPVNVYGQAGGSTVIATIVGKQKIATISLNEVDAAKVKVGQLVDITFDAIDGLTATGTVSVVDQIGTVSSGVVSYGIKIAINTDDERVKPGMSVNTSIITAQKDDIIIVPSATIKTIGGKSTVQVFDSSVMAELSGRPATSTRALASSTRQFSTSTVGTMARFQTNQSLSMTIPSATPPQQVIVTIGLSDDTNTEIVSGLSRGQFIVTKTIAAGTPQTTTAPSILNSLGARPGGGTTRTGAGMPAR